MIKAEGEIKVSLLEKMIINWAIIPDSVFYRTIYKFFNQKYAGKSYFQIVKEEWEERTRIYSKLLRIKKKYGFLPEQAKELCKKSPCGYTRLLLTYFR